MKRELGDDYVIILRTHYYIADKVDVTGMGDFVVNLSKYDDIAEIYLISDICITDYSSVFFDYANLRRPILYYTYDLDKYRGMLRGFYFNMEEEVPGPMLFTTEEVADAVKNIDKINEKYKEKYDAFYDKFCYLDKGNASEQICNEVFDLK
jgi:CDP-glycerol glycerophosphotransferase